MKHIKRIFSYAVHFKWMLSIACVLMLASIVIDLIPTKITQQILDNYISGIKYPWAEVSSDQEGAVLLDGRYFVQPDYHEVAAEHKLSDAAIVEIDNTFYLVEGVESVVEGRREYDASKEMLVVTLDGKSTVYEDVYALSETESKAIYAPYIGPVVKLLVILAVLYLSTCVINYLNNYMYAKVSIELATLLRFDMFDKMQKLPLDYFQNEADGRIVSKITNDTDAVRNFFSTIISIIIEGFFGFIIIYFYMYDLNPRFALLVLCIMPVIGLWIYIYRVFTNRYSKKIRALNSQINATINENIKGMRIIQAFNQEAFILGEFDEINSEYLEYRAKQMRLDMSVGGPVFGLFRRAAQIAVIMFFGYQCVYSGEIASYGMMYAFVTYLGKLLDPIDVILGSVEMLEEALVSSERVFTFLDLPEEKVDYQERVPDFLGHVRFDHISFKYTPTGPYVLKDVSFEVKPKQTIAFVGHTGSGKSTTMSLLMRFFDYEEGSIQIDGKELNSMSKQAFRRHVGMVLQDPVLFKGTIASNISLNDPEVTDEMILESLKSIGAEGLLEKYEKGIYAEVSNLGDNLSTGERQLLSFARAMLYDPSILILDEATANIDTETEQMIQRALKIASRDRTTFIVAHRLSTIKDADQIIVLDGGVILEQGTHDELISKKGKYYEMYLSQSNL